MNENFDIVLRVNAHLTDDVIRASADISDSTISKRGELTTKVIPSTEFDFYEGDYEVTPLITTQILGTSKKMMRDDLTIWMIPTKEEPNDAGGVTFTIGE